MDTATMSLEELIEELPPQLRAEVKHFAEFLITKHRYLPKKQRQLRQDWADALEDDKERYTSVELQHLASEWREE